MGIAQVECLSGASLTAGPYMGGRIMGDFGCCTLGIHLGDTFAEYHRALDIEHLRCCQSAGPRVRLCCR